MIERIGSYQVLEKLGEGGPPPLALVSRELRRDHAEAQEPRT